MTQLWRIFSIKISILQHIINDCKTFNLNISLQDHTNVFVVYASILLLLLFTNQFVEMNSSNQLYIVIDNVLSKEDISLFEIFFYWHS